MFLQGRVDRFKQVVEHIAPACTCLLVNGVWGDGKHIGCLSINCYLPPLNKVFLNNITRAEAKHLYIDSFLYFVLFQYSIFVCAVWAFRSYL